MKQSSVKLRSASDQLLKELGMIGAKLLYTGMCNPPRWHVLQDIDVKSLRELGSILLAISSGTPAGKVFRQNERKKPKKDRSNLAFVYLYMRACAIDIADDTAAIGKVKSVKSLDAPKSNSYIRKIAQRHRDTTFKFMEGKHSAILGERFFLCAGSPDELESFLADSPNKLQDWFRQHELTQDKVKKLRSYLEKKSRRDN